jgi:hypothetical protein
MCRHTWIDDLYYFAKQRAIIANAAAAHNVWVGQDAEGDQQEADSDAATVSEESAATQAEDSEKSGAVEAEDLGASAAAADQQQETGADAAASEHAPPESAEAAAAAEQAASTEAAAAAEQATGAPAAETSEKQPATESPAVSASEQALQTEPEGAAQQTAGGAASSDVPPDTSPEEVPPDISPEEALLAWKEHLTDGTRQAMREARMLRKFHVRSGPAACPLLPFVLHFGMLRAVMHLKPRLPVIGSLVMLRHWELGECSVHTPAMVEYAAAAAAAVKVSSHYGDGDVAMQSTAIV